MGGGEKGGPTALWFIELPFGVVGKVWKAIAVAVAHHRECDRCRQIVDLRVAHFMLGTF